MKVSSVINSRNNGMSEPSTASDWCLTLSTIEGTNAESTNTNLGNISKYINSLLAFDYSINNNFDAGDNF